MTEPAVGREVGYLTSQTASSLISCNSAGLQWSRVLSFRGAYWWLEVE